MVRTIKETESVEAPLSIEKHSLNWNKQVKALFSVTSFILFLIICQYNWNSLLLPYILLYLQIPALWSKTTWDITYSVSLSRFIFYHHHLSPLTLYETWGLKLLLDALLSTVNIFTMQRIKLYCSKISHSCFNLYEIELTESNLFSKTTNHFSFILLGTKSTIIFELFW